MRVKSQTMWYGSNINYNFNIQSILISIGYTAKTNLHFVACPDITNYDMSPNSLLYGNIMIYDHKAFPWDSNVVNKSSDWLINNNYNEKQNPINNVWLIYNFINERIFCNLLFNSLYKIRQKKAYSMLF